MIIPFDVNIGSIYISDNSSWLGGAVVGFGLEVVRVITKTATVSGRDLDVVVFLGIQVSDVVETLISVAINSEFITGSIAGSWVISVNPGTAVGVLVVIAFLVANLVADYWLSVGLILGESGPGNGNAITSLGDDSWGIHLLGRKSDFHVVNAV